MGTNCASLLADLLLYSYEKEVLDNMIRSGHRRLTRSINLCYRYTDDLIVVITRSFCITSQLTVGKANKSYHLTDYLDLTLIIDSGGKHSTMLFTNVMMLTSTLSIFHFPFLSSSIQSGPSYGIHIAGHRICTMILTSL